MHASVIGFGGAAVYVELYGPAVPVRGLLLCARLCSELDRTSLGSELSGLWGDVALFWPFPPFYWRNT